MNVYTTRNGETLHLCNGHLALFTECVICNRNMEPGTALDVFLNKTRSVRVCPRCVDSRMHISFCPDCKILSTDQYEREHTYCKQCGEIGSHVTLIVQDPDAQAENNDLDNILAEAQVASDTATQYVTFPSDTIFVSNIAPPQWRVVPNEQPQIVGMEALGARRQIEVELGIDLNALNNRISRYVIDNQGLVDMHNVRLLSQICNDGELWEDYCAIRNIQANNVEDWDGTDYDVYTLLIHNADPNNPDGDN